MNFLLGNADPSLVRSTKDPFSSKIYIKLLSMLSYSIDVEMTGCQSHCGVGDITRDTES